ncbi:MAG: sugar phosphate isomerase/epimerase [Acidobacteria bacterium]|nr:sugar phosphate isomerase/epimerase [Acidobacteriota bacterium]
MWRRFRPLRLPRARRPNRWSLRAAPPQYTVWMDRRTFLQTPLAAAAAAGPKIRLGFDSYTLRGFGWKAMRLIDYAASRKLDTLQISSLGDYESLDPAHLQKVKDHAERQGITLDGGIGCICPTAVQWNARYGPPAEYILTGLRVAKAVGAKAMRCFIGGATERRGPLPIEAHIEKTLEALRAVRSRALDTGVKIAIENHNGDLTAREMKALIEAAGPDLAGSCLDTGNPMWLLEDPLLTLEILGPYVATTHVRDSALCEHPRGAMFQWVAMGDSSMDWPPILALFRKVCPQAAMQLEIITGRPPQVLPYLEPDFWKAFPKLPAADFARFVALAKRGRPYLGPMMIGGTASPPPPEYEAALREQQRVDLERSIEYTRKLLG